MPTDYFDDRVAERYDEATRKLAEPAVVELLAVRAQVAETPAGPAFSSKWPT